MKMEHIKILTQILVNLFFLIYSFDVDKVLGKFQYFLERVNIFMKTITVWEN